MKYRQWKKNYKKRYGVNPPASIDKRKQRKIAKCAYKHLVDMIAYTDFSRVVNNLKDAVASIMFAMSSACHAAGTVFQNMADSIQPKEQKAQNIKGK